MKKRFIFYILFIVSLCFMSLLVLGSLGQINKVMPLAIPTSRITTQKVVLLPLDSRPACTQFVEQLGRIAQIEVITPPIQYLDHYKHPADKSALRVWLKQSIKGADAAVISTDMLIHGGLLASRLSSGSATDIAETIELLKTLHQENPKTKIYVFNIIPRLLIADNAENVNYQKKLFQYSILTDQISTFENPLDIKKRNKLADEIPEQVIANYLDLYKRNSAVNLALIDLAAQGVIDKLVIGQDDGNLFGVPNMTKQRLEHYVKQSVKGSENKVFLTRGTDEVAVTLLGLYTSVSRGLSPRVHVMYSDSYMSQIAMPFMPHSVATTVKEKIELLGGTIVSSPQQADFILYVHAGTRNSTPFKLKAAANNLKALIEQGFHVALVDLTEDFYASETLLPVLIAEEVPITRLAAYAGWNTTSNSIGTAVTEAMLFTQQLREQKNDNQEIFYYDHLSFLITRMLDDWYYLKDVQPIVNHNLRAVDADPYNLADNYQKTNDLIARLMNERAIKFFQQALYNRPIRIGTGKDSRNIVITDLEIKTTLPWERTFEIKLETNLSLAELP